MTLPTATVQEVDIEASGTGTAAGQTLMVCIKQKVQHDFVYYAGVPLKAMKL